MVPGAVEMEKSPGKTHDLPASGQFVDGFY
jgi:hypothetical protein